MENEQVSASKEISNLEKELYLEREKEYRTNQKKQYKTQLLGEEREYQKLSDIYFKPKPFERWKNGQIYEWLGAKYIKKIIMGTAGKLLKLLGADKYSSNYFLGKEQNIEALRAYERQTRFNEIIHAPLTISTGYNLLKSLGEEKYAESITWGILFLVNSSCTIFQRYNRVRVNNIIEKKLMK